MQPSSLSNPCHTHSPVPRPPAPGRVPGLPSVRTLFVGLARVPLFTLMFPLPTPLFLVLSVECNFSPTLQNPLQWPHTCHKAFGRRLPCLPATRVMNNLVSSSFTDACLRRERRKAPRVAREQEDVPSQERWRESTARSPADSGLGPAEHIPVGCGYRRPRAEACTEAPSGYLGLTRPGREAGKHRNP